MRLQKGYKGYKSVTKTAFLPLKKLQIVTFSRFLPLFTKSLLLAVLPSGVVFAPKRTKPPLQHTCRKAVNLHEQEKDREFLHSLSFFTSTAFVVTDAILSYEL